MKSKKKDFWLNLSKAEKAGIMEGIAQLDEGKRIPFSMVLKKYHK